MAGYFVLDCISLFYCRCLSSIHSLNYKSFVTESIIAIMKFAAVAILSLAAGVIAQIDPEHCGPKYGNVVCKDNNCCSQYGWVRPLESFQAVQFN